MSNENVMNFPFSLEYAFSGNKKFMSEKSMHSALRFEEAMVVERLPVGKCAFIDSDGDIWRRVSA